MKLVVFGLTISSSWGNGHATLWRALCWALGDGGHTIEFFERDVPYYAAHRDLTEFRGGRLHLYTSWDDAVAAAQPHLADADAALVTSYCPDGAEAAELALGSPAGLRIFYDLDTPVTLDRFKSGETVPYLGPRLLADFDLVLSYTGGAALEELRTLLGARFVAPLYGHADPTLHRRVAPTPEYAADLSYLGTYAADRQAALEQLLIEPARRLPHRRFLVGGAQYPAEFPWTPNIYFVRHVEPARHPAFFSSSRLTLNVTRRAMAEMGYCPSGRLFEAAACGTAILSDRWVGLDEFFTPGEEILIARTPEDAAAALELSDAALSRIGRAARERAIAEHTPERRVRELERAMDEARAAARGHGVAAGAGRHAADASTEG